MRHKVNSLPSCNSAYMSKTNLWTHVRDTHKRKLKEVMEEQGMEYVYTKVPVVGSGRNTRIIGIKGIEVKNVGPMKVRERKGYKKLMPTSEVP